MITTEYAVECIGGRWYLTHGGLPVGGSYESDQAAWDALPAVAAARDAWAMAVEAMPEPKYGAGELPPLG
jgi:hypothetical protein